ncbi:MAG: DUF1573 domain-containing protein [Pirellulaceae bacterium]
MWRAFWIAAALAGAAWVVVVWASASATFLLHHPMHPTVRIEIDKQTGGAIVMREASLEQAAVAAVGSPVADAQETEYDFGTMNPLTMGKHEFVIRNVGQGPLNLRVGPTSCKCTVSGLDKQTAAPGETATVTLEWNTGKSPLYSHYATIYTNDPEKKSLDLRVLGRVRMQIGADVPEIVLPSLEPDRAATAEVLLYSQIWDSFSVESLDSKLPGLAWKVEPVEPQQAPQLAATAVQKLMIALPADLLQGKFRDLLRLQIRPSEANAEVQTLELPLHGTVQRRLAIYGSGINSDAVVELGTVTQGIGKRLKLLVKIRDREPTLPCPKLTASPEFLFVQLTPRSAGEAAGLYDLTIEIPAGTPACQYLGNPQGTIEIETGHPRIEDLELKVRFAVLQAARN